MEEAVDLWRRASELLARKMDKGEVYERWIAPLVPRSFDANRLVLEVDNDFQQDWVEKNFLPDIRDALIVAGCSGDVQIGFVCRETEELAPPQPPPQEVKPATKSSQRRNAIQQLNPEFTFENFVTGPSNSWAYNASGEVARKPGHAYNPLFIYGPTGIGKTHLMQAIGHRILATLPNVSIHYVTCEAMLNDYINCISKRDTFDNFRRRYRRTDVLMVDDIQFLAGKEGLQEEFFNTYNELYTRHKQIIMTSDQPPKEIAGLPERLVSRFGEGLVCQIESPNFETRLGILRYKQSQKPVKLSDELLTFIAQNITSNVRALEGALTRAVSFMALNNKTKLALDELRGLLKDLLDTEQQKDLSSEEVLRAVVEHFSLRMADMTSESRLRSIAEPRQLAMFLCRKLCNKGSYPEIGEIFGKTHPTVFHACRKIQEKLAYDRTLQTAASEIVRKLGRSPSILTGE